MEPDKMLDELKDKEEKLRNELVELEQMFGAKKEQYLKVKTLGTNFLTLKIR